MQDVTLLNENSRKVINSHKSNVELGVLMSLASTILIGGTVAMKDYTDNATKAIGLFMGCAITAGNIYHNFASRKTEKLAEQAEKLIAEQIAAGIVTAKKSNQFVSEMNSLLNQARAVENLPQYQQARFTHQYGLQGLVMPPNQHMIDETPQIQNAIQVKKALPLFTGKAEMVIDTSWMNQNFFYASGMVTGDEGSGKTQFLAMMALNILAICPEVDLRIHNIHYNKKKRWFPSMPLDVEESFFIKDAEECYQDMMNVKAEMVRREKTEDDTKPPIVRISDEFQGLKDYLGETKFEDYVDCCIQIKNRGRKLAYQINGEDTGIRVILGTHSIKQKMTGVDSSFANKLMVCLGSSILDSSAMFPGDFDMKNLIKQHQAATNELISAGLVIPGEPKKDQARAAIVRVPGGIPKAVFIPRIDLSKIQVQVMQDHDKVPLDDSEKVEVESNNPDWIMDLVNIARMNKSLPSIDEVKKVMYNRTNKQIPDDMAEQIRTIIEQHLNGQI